MWPVKSNDNLVISFKKERALDLSTERALGLKTERAAFIYLPLVANRVHTFTLTSNQSQATLRSSLLLRRCSASYGYLADSSYTQMATRIWWYFKAIHPPSPTTYRYGRVRSGQLPHMAMLMTA
jgi:hypothetical protein